MMLEQVLFYLNNWFIMPDGIHHGTFAIEGGGITLPFLQDGQYFRICGSIFSDGLHCYGPAMETLRDEVFTGIIWALAVPRVVIDLSEEIAAWQEKNGDIAASPYLSESFSGYSYSKASGADSSGGWQNVFAARLGQWRKLREYRAMQGGSAR